MHIHNIQYAMDNIYAHTYDGYGYMYGYVCGGFEYNGYYTLNTQDSPKCTSWSPKKVVKYNSIQEQCDFAALKYDKVLNNFMTTPCCNITSKMEEDIWAWGIFTETILPMLKFIDE